MKHASELIGFVFVILVCVWAALIVLAPPLEKPIAICRPVGVPFALMSRAGGAVNPDVGNRIQKVGDTMTYECLSYTARLVGIAPTPGKESR